ncbi:hypothetical protein [Paracidovorax wautersii]|uniref:CRISPR type IV/AFERR-associated protein Csf3 n=1 Tax=Paracidovorax wautersii TaxID=1177982 RepID=A0A1I2HQQ5_9BURK|nr:hypothetical protein [Paracidovorax wautersii]SFF31147.1 CRISPR type IV/AFERR-associated protein Csf3 [Paracidovorax wautersii]
MKPLRVDIVLGGLTAVPDRHPPLFDALLLACVGRRQELPFEPGCLPVRSVRDKRWAAGEFVWMASAIDITFVGPATDRFLHRNARPLELLDDAREHHATSVDFDRGLTKVTRKRFAVRQATHATAWCIGDQGEIMGLLQGLQALGAHRHLGLGLVRDVRVVEDASADVCCWKRPLPGVHSEDPYAAQRYRCAGRAVPPYWSRDLRLQAWWPADL